MRLISESTEESVAQRAALFISDAVESRKPLFEPFVLGLPTGRTPIRIYAELIKMYDMGLLTFKNVHTFTMSEYVGLGRDDPQSYWAFIHKNLFDHIDIPRENIHMLDGMAKDQDEECSRYERQIKQLGGIDLFAAEVGYDGHIAFNEPYSSLQSVTRVQTLSRDTIQQNAGTFFGGDTSKVPKYALTVGIKTILNAREVLVVATGSEKALAVQAAVEGSVSHCWPISALQMHPKSILLCDADAVEELKVKTLRFHQI
eukprot:GHVQ01022819.1.p1 GENE.GHVQ01022819.1~~GHVQ01022819.1.p1  ORF type:complete len:258 (+),score=23.23 GHVQ01022819.1:125-898(+)